MKNPTNFKLLLLVVGSIFFYSATVFSQALSSDFKYAEFDPKTEDIESFKQKATTFLNVLSSYESGTTGHFNLTQQEPLGRVLRKLADDDQAKRLVFMQVRMMLRGDTDKVEFWIVQKGSEGPFPVPCGLCDCPPPASIEGKAKLYGTEIELIYEANVLGSVKSTFSWGVAGGKIIKGQGTSRIVVKPNPGENVMVELEWRGDEVCGCRSIVGYTSKYEREL
ncbi:MAG TPA: hypothetical protein PKA82_01710 [Pyrinomonadaceae bacterium]|nr:hypothetical protein [Pyrinomonadaceae bacterium]